MKQALWILLLAAIALVTASFQLDRQSRLSPELAGFVPPIARYFSQPEFVSRALRSGPSERSVSEARALVQRRPVPAEHLRIFSQTQLAAGDIELGMTTIQLAARRGWRDRSTQEAMADIAVFAGAPDEAANRIAALMARYDDSEAVATLAQPALSQAAGRERMAEILASEPRWIERFLRLAPRSLERETLNAVLLSAHEKGARFPCAALQQVIATQARDTGVEEDQSPLAALAQRSC